LILSCIFSIVVKLTGEFTSLEEPTDDSDITAVAVFLTTDPFSSDQRGKLNPRNRRGSLGFQSSGPSHDPSLQRPE
jgi:hypothetical protein